MLFKIYDNANKITQLHGLHPTPIVADNKEHAQTVYLAIAKQMHWTTGNLTIVQVTE